MLLRIITLLLSFVHDMIKYFDFVGMSPKKFFFQKNLDFSEKKAFFKKKKKKKKKKILKNFFFF